MRVLLFFHLPHFRPRCLIYSATRVSSSNFANLLPTQRGKTTTVAPKMGMRVAAKAVGIDQDAKSRHLPDDLKARALGAVMPLDPFFEEDPTVKEWLLEQRPTLAGTSRYIASLFPFVRWIGHYNLQWLMGDVIGGKYFVNGTQKPIAVANPSSNQQALRSGSLLSLKQWPMQSLPAFVQSSDSTPPLPAPHSIGCSAHPKTSP